MNSSPIHSYLEKLNADFEESNGYLVARNYGDSNAETESVRKNLGFTDLSHRGKLVFSGKDHLKLLQGMLSNDILKLNNNEGVYACLLTTKGKMISDMRVYKSGQSVYMDVEQGRNKILKNIFTKYKLSYKAEIDDVTADFGLIHVCGPECPGTLAELFKLDNSKLKEYDHFDFENYKIIKVNRTGETGFDIIFENKYSDDLIDLLTNINHEILPFGSDSLEVLRTEAGIAVFGKDMDENTIPIEAGIWNSLNFEKGCYVGQEVIARIKWRGRVNWHLVGFKVDGKITPGHSDEIKVGEKVVGRITSSVFSEKMGSVIAMGYIRREFKEPGGEVEIIFSDNSKTTALVSEKSFYNHFQ